MKNLTPRIKKIIDKNYKRYKLLIDKYIKTEPKITYHYYNGAWYMSYNWSNDNTLIEFRFHKYTTDFAAFKKDESEWIDIDDHSKSSCRGNFEQRKRVESIIKEEYIQEAFGWLYE